MLLPFWTAAPLAGVPFLLKDLLAAWKGHTLTGSSRLLEGYVPDEDAEVVRRLHAAGLDVGATMRGNGEEVGGHGKSVGKRSAAASECRAPPQR